MNKAWKREKYIAMHAQSTRFRILKYGVLIVLSYLLFIWKGWIALISGLLTLAVLGVVLHFFFRSKTKGWTKSWGLFKKIRTPYDGK